MVTRQTTRELTKQLWGSFFSTIPPWTREVTWFFLGSFVLTAAMYVVAAGAGWILWVVPSGIEFTALWFNFLSVGLAARQSRWTWIFGIPAVILVGIIVANMALYGSMVLQLFYFLPLQFIGLFQWKYGGENRTELTVGWLKLYEWFWIITAGIIAWFGVAWVHAAVGGAISEADSAILVLSILAQWLMNTKRVESWLFWIAVNGFSIYTYFAGGIPVLGLQYVLFLLFAFYGAGSWWLDRYSKQWSDAPLLVTTWIRKTLRLA